MQRYPWVAQQEGIGEVGTTGIIYADIDEEQVLADPLGFKTAKGFTVPFAFKTHEVKID